MKARVFRTHGVGTGAWSWMVLCECGLIQPFGSWRGALTRAHTHVGEQHREWERFGEKVARRARGEWA